MPLDRLLALPRPGDLLLRRRPPCAVLSGYWVWVWSGWQAGGSASSAAASSVSLSVSPTSVSQGGPAPLSTALHDQRSCRSRRRSSTTLVTTAQGRSGEPFDRHRAVCNVGSPPRGLARTATVPTAWRGESRDIPSHDVRDRSLYRRGTIVPPTVPRAAPMAPGGAPPPRSGGCRPRSSKVGLKVGRQRTRTAGTYGAGPARLRPGRERTTATRRRCSGQGRPGSE